MTIKSILTTLTILCLTSSSGWAGIYLENQENLPNGKDAGRAIAWVDTGHVRIDVKQKNKDYSYIYDQGQGKLWVLNHTAKNYREIDAVKLEQQAAKGYDLVPVSFALYGPGESIGSWLCKVYQGNKNNLKQTQLWTVDPRQLNLSSDAYKTLQGARAYLQTYAPETGAFFHAGSRAYESNQGYAGIPVKMVNYGKDGKISSSIALVKAEDREIAAEQFVVPAGYKKAL